jgi:hypothetical protein
MLLNCPYGCYVLKTAAEMSNIVGKKLINSSVMRVYPLLHQKKLKARWDEIIAICG